MGLQLREGEVEARWLLWGSLVWRLFPEEEETGEKRPKSEGENGSCTDQVWLELPR